MKSSHDVLLEPLARFLFPVFQKILPNEVSPSALTIWMVKNRMLSNKTTTLQYMQQYYLH